MNSITGCFIYVNTASAYRAKNHRRVDRRRQRLYNLTMNISDHRSDIGKKVRQERLKQGWTQEELAEKVDMCASFIGQIERGVKAVSMDTLERLSLVFGINSAEFLKRGGDTKSSYRTRPMEEKVASLLKGYSSREQKVVYQTLKYMLRQNRKLAK